MKVVSITDMRQDATKLVAGLARTHEPVLVCARSRPVAYLVEAEAFEAMQDELKRLRHELFWQGVAEAKAEHATKRGRVYESADALIADLGLED